MSENVENCFQICGLCCTCCCLVNESEKRQTEKRRQRNNKPQPIKNEKVSQEGLIQQENNPYY